MPELERFSRDKESIIKVAKFISEIEDLDANGLLVIGTSGLIKGLPDDKQNFNDFAMLINPNVLVMSICSRAIHAGLEKDMLVLCDQLIEIGIRAKSHISNELFKRTKHN